MLSFPAIPAPCPAACQFTFGSLSPAPSSSLSLRLRLGLGLGPGLGLGVGVWSLELEFGVRSCFCLSVGSVGSVGSVALLALLPLCVPVPLAVAVDLDPWRCSALRCARCKRCESSTTTDSLLEPARTTKRAASSSVAAEAVQHGQSTGSRGSDASRLSATPTVFCVFFFFLPLRLKLPAGRRLALSPSHSPCVSLSFSLLSCRPLCPVCAHTLFFGVCVQAGVFLFHSEFVLRSITQ